MASVYYVFDVDGTLTDQYSYFLFLADFKPRGIYKDDVVKYEIHLRNHLTDKTQKYLDVAYKQFVHLVAQKESSDVPLGILRPGLLDVCREILRQIHAGECGGALMYSNNPNGMVLEFIRDIIHEILGEPIFCALADWNHPLRTPEITAGEPGAADKTWRVLQQIILKDCGERVTPRQVMFFDDQHHPNLEEVLPAGNYIHVTPYTYKTSIDSIKTLYSHAMKYPGNMDSNLKMNIVNYIKNVQTDLYPGNKTRISSLSNHIAYIKVNSPNSAINSLSVPPPDNSAHTMLTEVTAFPKRHLIRGGGYHKTRRNRYTTQHSRTRKKEKKTNKL